MKYLMFSVKLNSVSEKERERERKRERERINRADI
jgi:hypothetical protein